MSIQTLIKKIERSCGGRKLDWKIQWRRKWNPDFFLFKIKLPDIYG